MDGLQIGHSTNFNDTQRETNKRKMEQRERNRGLAVGIGKGYIPVDWNIDGLRVPEVRMHNVLPPSVIARYGRSEHTQTLTETECLESFCALVRGALCARLVLVFLQRIFPEIEDGAQNSRAKKRLNEELRKTFDINLRIEFTRVRKAAKELKTEAEVNSLKYGALFYEYVEDVAISFGELLHWEHTYMKEAIKNAILSQRTSIKVSQNDKLLTSEVEDLLLFLEISKQIYDAGENLFNLYFGFKKGYPVLPCNPTELHKSLHRLRWVLFLKTKLKYVSGDLEVEDTSLQLSEKMSNWENFRRAEITSRPSIGSFRNCTAFLPPQDMPCDTGNMYTCSEVLLSTDKKNLVRKTNRINAFN